MAKHEDHFGSAYPTSMYTSSKGCDDQIYEASCFSLAVQNSIQMISRAYSTVVTFTLSTDIQRFRFEDTIS